ncbi:thioredoxin [Anaeramoeba flamelloides]|uniref:Thioredoxin n=1 Tax=Anaeramoeba flamelloides TaxID=1746091 RepID=A0ABQ8Y987_9EUKA|nr:thioredoxin [Anaeramoeba flamelloides]
MPVFFYWYANWCSHCAYIQPYLEILINSNPNISYIRIDIDKNEKVCEKYGIECVPTFELYSDSKKKKQIIGIKKEQLTELLQQYNRKKKKKKIVLPDPRLLFILVDNDQDVNLSMRALIHTKNQSAESAFDWIIQKTENEEKNLCLYFPLDHDQEKLDCMSKPQLLTFLKKKIIQKRRKMKNKIKKLKKILQIKNNENVNQIVGRLEEKLKKYETPQENSFILQKNDQQSKLKNHQENQKTKKGLKKNKKETKEKQKVVNNQKSGDNNHKINVKNDLKKETTKRKIPEKIRGIGINKSQKQKQNFSLETKVKDQPDRKPKIRTNKEQKKVLKKQQQNKLNNSINGCNCNNKLNVRNSVEQFTENEPNKKIEQKTCTNRVIPKELILKKPKKGGSCKIYFILPSKKIIEKELLSVYKISTIFNYIKGKKELKNKQFRLVDSKPPNHILDNFQNRTLVQCGLYPTGIIWVEFK